MHLCLLSASPVQNPCYSELCLVNAPGVPGSELCVCWRCIAMPEHPVKAEDGALGASAVFDRAAGVTAALGGAVLTTVALLMLLIAF